jgi:polar amino acid transport system permease protein
VIYQTIPEPILDYFKVFEYWDHILSGFIITMWLYACALTIGFVLGLLLAFTRQYGGLTFSKISTGYIELVRGTPLLVQLLLLYFIPFSLNWPIGNWEIASSFTLFDKNIKIIFFNYTTLIGIVALSLNSAAYQAEYFRGAIVSVGAGQLMAAQSLGMTKIGSIRHVILPQALRRVIPAWSNEAVYLPKYTTVVYFIGVKDLFREAHFIVTATFRSLATYIIVAIIFLIVISIISKGLDIVYARTKIPGL